MIYMCCAQEERERVRKMKFQCPLIAVSDMERSKQFYFDVLGLSVVADFGANVTLTGGVALQTRETWLRFIGKREEELVFGGNAGELYFEEDDFDGFLQKLAAAEGVALVHPAVEHAWGQRAVRFYDPDRHIVEVGENMAAVVRRFAESGLSAEETAKRMDVPVEYVKSLLS